MTGAVIIAARISRVLTESITQTRRGNAHVRLLLRAFDVASVVEKHFSVTHTHTHTCIKDVTAFKARHGGFILLCSLSTSA